MNTQHIYTRTLVYFTLILFLVTSCAQHSPAVQTETAIIERARFTLDGVDFQADASTIAGDLWAVQKVIDGSRGAYMLYDCERQLAVFISEGGKMVGGGRYFFYGVIDISHNALVDAGRQLRALGIDVDDITSLDQLKTILQRHGFTQYAASSLPLLASAVRLGMGFLKSLGGTLSEVLVVPAGALTPEMLYPWVDPDFEPGIN